jgi:hypothetical protein
MVACALTGNISGEATNPLGNILREAMRQQSRIFDPKGSKIRAQNVRKLCACFQCQLFRASS